MKFPILSNYSQKGTGLIEYVLLIALISLIGLASISNLGDALNKKFVYIGDAIDNAGNVNAGDGAPQPGNPSAPPSAPTGPMRPGRASGSDNN